MKVPLLNRLGISEAGWGNQTEATQPLRHKSQHSFKNFCLFQSSADINKSIYRTKGAFQAGIMLLLV